jgi:hypothetical protein
MRTATILGILAVLMTAEPAAASPADQIKYDETRPMMKLTGELVNRYGYLVTYEDAPVPKEAIFTEKRRIGPDYSYPVWKPVTFHVDARLPAAPDASGSQEPAASDAQPPLGQIRPLGPSVIDPLVQEYNSSGNPGQFKVIYDGDYAHVVPAGFLQGGRLVPFEPILSTEVAVNLQFGTCWDLLNGLVDEVRQARDVKIMIWAAPASPLTPEGCSFNPERHNLPARDVLVQLLAQIGKHGRNGSAAEDRFKLPEEQYRWGFVYEPTTETYFLSIRSVQSPEEPISKPKVQPRPADPAAANALINSLFTYQSLLLFQPPRRSELSA